MKTKTQNAEYVKNLINKTIQFLIAKGYKVLENRGDWESKLNAHINDKEVTSDNYFFRIELAPEKWPQFAKYPDVRMEETPYAGLIFSLTSERWLFSEKTEIMHHSDKKRLMREYKLKESDICSQWSLQIKDFPLFSNNSGILHPDLFTEGMEKAETFILEMEKRTQDHFAVKK